SPVLVMQRVLDPVYAVAVPALTKNCEELLRTLECVAATAVFRSFCSVISVPVSSSALFRPEPLSIFSVDRVPTALLSSLKLRPPPLPDPTVTHAPLLRTLT